MAPRWKPPGPPWFAPTRYKNVALNFHLNPRDIPTDKNFSLPGPFQFLPSARIDKDNPHGPCNRGLRPTPGPNYSNFRRLESVASVSRSTRCPQTRNCTTSGELSTRIYTFGFSSEFMANLPLETLEDFNHETTLCTGHEEGTVFVAVNNLGCV